MSKWWRNTLLATACGAAVWGLRMTLAAPAPNRASGDDTRDAPAAVQEERSLQSAPPSAGATGKLVPQVTPEMRRYSYTRYALAFIGAFYELAALALVMETGLSRRLRELAERRLGHPFVRAAAYTLLFGAVYTALLFPLSFTSGWYVEQRYRLSRQSLPAWLWDGVKGLLVSAVIAPPMVWLLYACIRRSPRRWWLGFWLASLPLLTFLVLVAPVVIDPLFNRFEPLRDAALREKILALAARAGIEGGRVYQVDMSTKTRALNAYVNGLGGTKRIVLWDTLLARLKEDEILFVMGHEMAHYVCHHVLIILGTGFGGLFLFFGLTDRAARALLARRGERWGVTDIGDLASLPVILGVLSALQFLAMPAVGAISRTMERQADAFGLRLTGNGEAAARAFVKLSEGNLSLPSPPPFVEFWLFTHPPLQDRIDRALAFDRSAGGTRRSMLAVKAGTRHLVRRLAHPNGERRAASERSEATMRPFQVGVSRDLLLPGTDRPMAEVGLDTLTAGGASWQFLPADPGYDGEIAPELIAGCDGLFILGSRFTARSFSGAVSERLVCLARWGVGYDRIDVPACTAAGVALTITPDGVRRPVAVAALGLILALALKLPLKDRLAREGRAAEKVFHFGIGLTGRTLGSVGLGNIGRELFRLAAPLEMRHLAADPYARPEAAAALGVELVPLERLLREADFLCINTPLTTETRGFIDAAALAQMKPTAYLINTARGAIVQTEALTQALQAGRLAGAGLDVTDPEPLPPDHPLCRMENVILAPHALAWTDEIALNSGRQACASLLACARGEAPALPQLVNPEVLENSAFRAKLERWRLASK